MATTTADWDVAVGTGLLRLGVGAVLLRFQRPLIQLSGGDPDDRTLRALFTYFGVRDFTLGVSALSASRPGQDVRRQVLMQAAADTADGVALAAVVSSGRLPRARGFGLSAIALGTAVTGIGLAWRLGRDG